MKFYNIEEQRFWNDRKSWTKGGHEWSNDKDFKDTNELWNKFIFEHLKPFRGKRILEIAPGFGRLTQYLVILASELTVVDLNQLCIDETRKKLGGHIEKYYVNDGKTLPVDNESQELVFSFDSFVHMHANVIESYIEEMSRVLTPGGHGFIHHSWFEGGSNNSFENYAGRSNMNPELFKEMVESNGMEIVFQNVKFDNGDYISFFKK